MTAFRTATAIVISARTRRIMYAKFYIHNTQHLDDGVLISQSAGHQQGRPARPPARPPRGPPARPPARPPAGQHPTGNNRTAAARPAPQAIAQYRPGLQKVRQADPHPLLVTGAVVLHAVMVRSRMDETKASHETLAAARMRRMRQ